MVVKFLADIAPLRRDDLSIRPLSPEGSVKASAALRATTLLAEGLGAIVLVDPGNSNAYVYVSRGLQAGSVFQFDHDAGIELAFPSLAAFASALRKAVKVGMDIDDLPHATAKPLEKQVALAARIVGWVNQSKGPAGIATDAERDALRENENNVASHLPRLDPDDIDTLNVVVASRNFLVREAAAVFMVKHARRTYVPLAQTLAVDSYGQVWRPARQLLTALRAKQPPLTEEQDDEIIGDERGTVGIVFSMVLRANGQVRLIRDDVASKGSGSTFTWEPTGDAQRFDFSPAEIEELRQGKSSLDSQLADIGSRIVRRIELLQKKGRRSPKAPKRR